MLQGYIDFFMDSSLAECYLKLKEELDRLIQKKVSWDTSNIFERKLLYVLWQDAYATLMMHSFTLSEIGKCLVLLLCWVLLLVLSINSIWVTFKVVFLTLSSHLSEESRVE